MKAKDSSITMKICPDKWEVKWLTSGWPALTSDDLKSVLKYMHDVYKKKAELPRISFVTTFLFCSWPYDLSWPWFDNIKSEIRCGKILRSPRTNRFSAAPMRKSYATLFYILHFIYLSKMISFFKNIAEIYVQFVISGVWYLG